VTLAGLVNALKIVGKKLDKARITMVGSGAANIATGPDHHFRRRRPGKLIMVDSKQTLHKGRTELQKDFKRNGTSARSPTPSREKAASLKPWRVPTRSLLWPSPARM